MTPPGNIDDCAVYFIRSVPSVPGGGMPPPDIFYY